MRRSAKADFKQLGPRLGKAMKGVAAAIAGWGDAEIRVLLEQGSIEVVTDQGGFEIKAEDVEILSEEIGDWSVAYDGGITVALDTRIDDTLRAQGYAREAVNRIQSLRKKLDLALADPPVDTGRRPRSAAIAGTCVHPGDSALRRRAAGLVETFAIGDGPSCLVSCATTAAPRLKRSVFAVDCRASPPSVSLAPVARLPLLPGAAVPPRRPGGQGRREPGPAHPQERATTASSAWAEIGRVIDARFDFRSMSQSVLSSIGAPPPPRSVSSSSSSQYLEDTYRTQIEFPNQSVEYVGEQIRKDRAIVDTVIVTDTNRIPVTYRLKDNEGEWFCYDVIIEGVSLVNNYRNTFNAIIKSEGMDGLLLDLEGRIADYKAKHGGLPEE